MRHPLDAKERQLAAHPAFHGLPRRKVRRLAALLDLTTVPAGTVLARAGHLVTTVAIVAPDAVAASDLAGHPVPATVAVGVREAVDGDPYAATIVATRPTEVLVTVARDVDALLRAAPHLAELATPFALAAAA